ncbi:MAG: hypothetical protein RRC34_02100 [Lentisphaeria bacterium]|nr:hypothetical protein [Lentisphaeria bacterium]
MRSSEKTVECVTMNTEGEIEFLRAYKDFVYYFNMLERNIGYCLRFCSGKEGNQNPEKWHSANFDAKVKKVIALAKKYGVYEAFTGWHREIKKCRHLRNIVSHGSWEWKWWLPKPIFFHAPEFEDGKGEFTVEEFQERLSHLRNVPDVFRAIRSRLESAIGET